MSTPTEFNKFIDVSNQYTRPLDEVPIVDRSSHVGLGLSLIQHAAQNQPASEPPAKLIPIVPIAN